MEKEIEQCVEILLKGGTLLYPTETIWGIGCDATNAEAIDKIYTIKQRDPQKSMLILCSDLEQVRNYVATIPPQVQKILSKSIRPTTIIYPQAKNLPSNLVALDGSIGIRIAGSVFCKNLIKKLKKPIVSTSANFSGQASPKNFFDIDETLKKRVSFVVNPKFDNSEDTQSSMILKITDKGDVVVIRK